MSTTSLAGPSASRDPDVSAPEIDTAVPDLDESAPTADLVRVYLTEIGRTPLLDAEQEVDLARRIEAGVYAAELLRRADAGEQKLTKRRRTELTAVDQDGRAAKSHMLQANLRLVVSIAKKFSQRGVPFLDVVQEGNVGLIRAVEKFDYRKGFKFSTYATWWVRQAIGRGLAEQNRTIRLPVHVVETVGKLRRGARQLENDLGRDPTNEELAELLGEDVDRVDFLRDISRDSVSLETPVGSDGDTVLGDLVADPDEMSAAEVFERQAMASELNGLVDQLPAREALIVRMRHGLYDGKPHTLDEIGRHVGLTRERVRQLEKEAIVRLRHPSSSDRLLDWAS